MKHYRKHHLLLVYGIKDQLTTFTWFELRDRIIDLICSVICSSSLSINSDCSYLWKKVWRKDEMKECISNEEKVKSENHNHIIFKRYMWSSLAYTCKAAHWISYYKKKIGFFNYIQSLGWNIVETNLQTNWIFWLREWGIELRTSTREAH